MFFSNLKFSEEQVPEAGTVSDSTFYVLLVLPSVMCEPTITTR